MAPPKKSKIVILKVSPEALRRVPATPTHNRVKNTLPKNPASSPTPIGATPEPKVSGATKAKQQPGKRKSTKLSASSAGSGPIVAPSSPYAGDDTVSTPKPSGSSTAPKTAVAATIAGVKALDRSGKPCRRWTKKDLQISSFTGVRYTIKSWTGERDKVDKSENETVTDDIEKKVAIDIDEDGKENTDPLVPSEKTNESIIPESTEAKLPVKVEDS